MTTKKVFKYIRPIIIFLFWLSVWQVAALIVNNPYFLPSIPQTIEALFKVIHKDIFFPTVFASLMRVLAGLALGTLLGLLFALLAHHIPFVEALISPVVSVMKAIPVASFIILLWVSVKGNPLTVFIAFLMVFPVIWQNLMDAYRSIDNELTEVAQIFEFSFFKKLKFLILPALKKYLAPALITSVGLAWKSEIAAEIIAYTAKSIGQYIKDANEAYDTATVFAWTLVIVAFSILLETLAKHILKRWNK